MERFTIQKNDFLSHDCIGYFHLYYVGYGQPGNPDYLNILKIYLSLHIPICCEQPLGKQQC